MRPAGYTPPRLQRGRRQHRRWEGAGNSAVTNLEDVPSPGYFQDRQESEFYAQCVRDFLFRYGYERLEVKEVVELGVGTGETIVELLKYHSFAAKIRGYEIHGPSYQYAQRVVEANSISDQYLVINDDFFNEIPGSVVGGCAISNPPYLPAPDSQIKMPELWGGPDGSGVTKRIIECGFEQLILLFASFSNPVSIIEHASAHGYKVLDFAVRSMQFGSYSSEPRVYDQILELERNCQAFVSDDRYCLAGVAWVRNWAAVDLSAPLTRAITSLEAAGDPPGEAGRTWQAR